MEHQIAEFEDLHHRDILISQLSQTSGVLEYRVPSGTLRLLNRMQKFVAISDTSVRAVGGPQNMVRALIRSQDFSFIDVTESEMFTATELVEAVKGLKSVTGVALSLGAAAEKEALQAVESNVDSAVAAKQDVCFFKNATVTDYFRKGHPYLHFRDKGESSCIVYFHTNVKCDHILTLQHCTTMSNGKVDIYLNSHALESTWGRSPGSQIWLYQRGNPPSRGLSFRMLGNLTSSTLCSPKIARDCIGFLTYFCLSNRSSGLRNYIVIGSDFCFIIKNSHYSKADGPYTSTSSAQEWYPEHLREAGKANP